MAGEVPDDKPTCRVRIGSADGVLAVIPHMLGFHPRNSVVILGVGGPHRRIRLTFRYDLPNPPDEHLAADIAEHATAVLRRQHLRMAVVVGYGTGSLVTPVTGEVTTALRAAGIELRDVLRVDDGRYWSYLCGDPACCPPEGVAFFPQAHPAAVALAAAGLPARADRAELARTLDQDPRAIEPMRLAVERALRRAGALVNEGLNANAEGDALRLVVDAGLRAVRTVIHHYRCKGELTDRAEIAWIGLALTDLRVRDDAWARMIPEFAAAHERLWTDLIRQLPKPYVPAPAALLAFTAWQSGNGALASIAIERALDADPSYSMALLISEALHAGLPPSAARLSMTPKQVAASYARRKPGRRAEAC